MVSLVPVATSQNWLALILTAAALATATSSGSVRDTTPEAVTPLAKYLALLISTIASSYLAELLTDAPVAIMRSAGLYAAWVVPEASTVADFLIPAPAANGVPPFFA